MYDDIEGKDLETGTSPAALKKFLLESSGEAGDAVNEKLMQLTGNPQIAALLATLTEMVADPANLIPGGKVVGGVVGVGMMAGPLLKKAGTEAGLAAARLEQEIQRLMPAVFRSGRTGGSRQDELAGAVTRERDIVKRAKFNKEIEELETRRYIDKLGYEERMKKWDDAFSAKAAKEKPLSVSEQLENIRNFRNW